MKIKIVVSLLAAVLMLNSCGNPQKSSDNQDEFAVDLSFPSKVKDEHTWKEKEFKPFPEYPSIASSLNYRLSEDKTFYIVSKATNSYPTSVIIPSAYQDLPVKEIETEGFAYLNHLQTVYIPSSIEKIGNGAFNGTGLKTIYYDAKNVADFNAKNWVFYPSDNQSIDFYVGPNVNRIPSRLFYPLTTNPGLVPHVNHIYFDENCEIKEIGDYAFYKLNQIESVSLPDTIEKIGDYAFYESGLKELSLPTMCKTIGENAFSYNSALAHVRFNENLEEIKNYGFYGCKALENIDLTSTKIESLSSYSFASCAKVARAYLPNGLKEIKEGAFEQDEALTSVRIPDNVTGIGDEAFKNCSYLEAIYLGQKVTELGKRAFANCVKVKKLLIYSTHINDLASDNQVFWNLGKDMAEVVVVLKDVEKIPACLFYASAMEEEQPHITQLILDQSIQEIGNSAFLNLQVEKVDYLGSVNKWNQITIHDYNTLLNKVKCHENVKLMEN